jgi:hypothetical protein
MAKTYEELVQLAALETSELRSALEASEPEEWMVTILQMEGAGLMSNCQVRDLLPWRVSHEPDCTCQ